MNRRSNQKPSDRSQRSGVILLVVLSSLTFFSLLVVSYFVFATQSRSAAFTGNVSTTRASDHRELMGAAMMTVLRGTNDVTSPFHGESILNDKYGSDGAEMKVADGAATYFGDGFVRFHVEKNDTTSGTRLAERQFHDMYSGRILTFREGPLRNHSFRVIRSRYVPDAGAPTDPKKGVDSFYIEILPEQVRQFGPAPSTTQAIVRTLFHRNTTTGGYRFLLNGTARNSRGLGDNGTNLDQTVSTPGLREQYGFSDLPVALQPSFVRHPNFNTNNTLDKSNTTGDFDEGHDAADYMNWFLSHRNPDGSVIPSFHRPSVINYILNQPKASGDTLDQHYEHLVASLSRATMRPVPIAAGQFPNSGSFNAQFTGGNSDFALRMPLLIKGNGAQTRLHLLAKALITSFDVDCDGDGKPDAVWTNPGLPLITSPEGKHLRPMVAMMIEDLSARLNINSSGSDVLDPGTPGVEANAYWGGYRAGSPYVNSAEPAFRGIGYGPADIVIPTAANNTAQINEVKALIKARYGIDNEPGTAIEDPLDILRTGSRLTAHGGSGASFGFSIDPFGRHGVGIGRDGHLVTAAAQSADEKLNDPYEFDPTGKLAGDNPFNFAQFESVLRANDFDTELLPQEVRNELRQLINAKPEMARAITTASISMDAPEWTLLQFVGRLNQLGTANQTLVNQLIAPEFRLGRRLDVNRPFGNGLDDDSDMMIDEPSEVRSEANAFHNSSPSGYQTSPDYNFDLDNTTGPTGRELLARHLYVLMMMLTSDTYEFPNVAAADANAYRARRLAQWAVNVVDYRDPDSIMTRFRFDPSPFDGWAPPGGAENVVWGVESPELLLRESLCFHDVRLRDVKEDGGDAETKRPVGDTSPGPFDNDSDQVRVPQGSTFIELQCVHPVNNSDLAQKFGFSGDIYTNSRRLDLAATNAQGVPVWRLAFSEPHDAGTAKEAVSPLSLRAADPVLAAFAVEDEQEREIDARLGGANSLNLQRFVWFTNFATQQDIVDLINNASISDMNPNGVFFAPAGLNGNKLLEPGQFLSIAPRTITHMGSKEVGGTFPGKPSDHRFVWDTAGSDLVLRDRSDTRRTPNMGAAGDHYSNALTLFVGGHRPNNWPADAFQDGHIGLNISAPLRGNYYTTPTNFHSYNTGADTDADGNPDYELLDGYLDFSDTATHKALDTPQDVSKGILPTTGDEPALGTIENFRTVYLQRLADPTADYDTTTNPYRTIDWMSLDLTVFSGEERASKIDDTGQYARRSLQRTGDNKNILYSYETNSDAPGTIAAGAADYFVPQDGYFKNSLGYLNTEEANGNPGFQGYSASIGSHVNTITNHDRNLPDTPYAVHPWLNRPFASHLELMMVPACSQTRLLEEFSVATAGNQDIYPVDGTDPDIFSGAFTHLLNFFHSSDKPGSSSDSAQFARIFDFVHTLPRFKGEVDVVKPSRLGTGAGTTDENFLHDLLRPPFNLQYDNHRNGRVNLNTLAEFPAWAGLMQGHMNPNEFTNKNDGGQMSFRNMVSGRRGYAPGTLSTVITGSPGDYNYDPANLNPNYPTQFAGVYKHALDSHFAPQTRTDDPAVNAPKRLRLREANSTLLRVRGPVDTNDQISTMGTRDNPTPVSQFVRGHGQTPSQTNPDTLHQNRQRNPFVRYQTLMRMPNLVSDNSQLFLVRMTLGFFEVSADNVDSLGREFNADRGQNKRYQATFLIDRSKPVGFSPGENLNVRDAVIFESYAQ